MKSVFRFLAFTCIAVLLAPTVHRQSQGDTMRMAKADPAVAHAEPAGRTRKLFARAFNPVVDEFWIA